MSTEESQCWGSVGRLVASSEAKIVDPDTGIARPPGEQGELWIRGPTIMKGTNKLYELKIRGMLILCLFTLI